MFHGVWQLAKQSLTTDARRPGTHAVRLGLAVVLYFAICWASASTWRSAAGLPLFHAQLWITAFYLTMNAIFGFSQTITEEKEDGTLSLMRLTAISSLSVILGKLAGRLTDAALLLVLQFPFTIVAITLGGVSWPQVYAAYVALAAYLWLLASVGMMASVIQSTGAKAALWTALLILIYLLPPYIFMGGPLRWPGLISMYHFISLPMRLTDVTESSFGSAAWCSPVAFALIVGLACLLWAWWSFDEAIIGPKRVRRLMPLPTHRRESRRVWSQPVVWREFVFLTGGLQWLILRASVPVVILLAMPVFHDRIFRVFAWAGIWSGVFSLIDGTWSASRLFRDEIKDRTWSTLVQTPHSISRLAFDKALGWAMGMLPSIVMPFVFVLMAELTYPHGTFAFGTELLIGALTIEVAIFAYLHLLVLMTLYVGWQATPLTLTVSFAAGWLYVVTVYSFRPSTGREPLVFGITIAVLCLVARILQLLVIRRLTVLAATA